MCTSYYLDCKIICERDKFVFYFYAHEKPATVGYLVGIQQMFNMSEMLKFDNVHFFMQIRVVEILLRGTIVYRLIFLKLLKLSAISSVTLF